MHYYTILHCGQVHGAETNARNRAIGYNLW
jgi:hypothetical protein